MKLIVHFLKQPINKRAKTSLRTEKTMNNTCCRSTSDTPQK